MWKGGHEILLSMAVEIVIALATKQLIFMFSLLYYATVKPHNTWTKVGSRIFVIYVFAELSKIFNSRGGQFLCLNVQVIRLGKYE